MRNSAATKRILIVEDEAAVGLMLAEALSDQGHQVIGPVESHTEALSVVEQTRPEVAILDITLRDGFCGPLINELRNRGIPFMVFSGQGRSGAVADKLVDVPWVKKPGRLHEISAALDSLPPASRQHEEPKSFAPSAPARVYPDELESAMQQELAALADIELRYERLAERLAGWSGPQAIRDRLVQQLAGRRQKEREPHVLRLAELHQRMMAVAQFPRRSLH